MSSDVIGKICELLDIIAEQNKDSIWDVLSALGTCVTPIVCVVISWLLGRKMEKQKEEVSQANTATLSMVKNKMQWSSEDIYMYIKACITVNTNQVSGYFGFSIDESLERLNDLKSQKKIKVYETGSDKGEWLWQTM